MRLETTSRLLLYAAFFLLLLTRQQYIFRRLAGLAEPRSFVSVTPGRLVSQALARLLCYGSPCKPSAVGPIAPWNAAPLLCAPPLFPDPLPCLRFAFWLFRKSDQFLGIALERWTIA